MSLNIVHEGVTKNPSSAPMSAFSLNPETQSFIEGGGGVHVERFFTYTILMKRLYWQPLSFKSYHVGVQTPKWEQH